MEKENDERLNQMSSISEEIISLSTNKELTIFLIKELIGLHTESMKEIVKDSFTNLTEKYKDKEEKTL